MKPPACSGYPVLAVLSHVSNFVAASAAAYAASVIPKFAAIYHDALPPEPLPSFTVFVLRFHRL